MSYQTYSEYTKAGNLCLTTIPKHWEVRRLKFMATVCNGRDQKEVLDDNGPYDIFGSGGVFGKSSTYLYDKVSVLLGRKGTIDKPLFIERPFWTVDTMFYTQIAAEVDPKYFFYLCCTIPFDLHRDQTTLPSMTQTGLANIEFPFAPMNEQQKIAAYLDWKTGQIDALIAWKQALMDKLKEKRLAVITQAVTKGLNPDAPMRDSGIAWLGAVPEHWQVKPVKFLARIVRGQFSHRPRNDPAFYEGEYPFIQTGDIARAGKYVATYSQTLNERGLSVSRQFPSGTLVMTIAANIGDMAIIQFPACFPDSIVGFIPEPNIDLNFLYYMFVAMKQRLMMTAVLNTQLNLNIDRIASIEAIAPPAKEQKAIVEYLDKTEARIQLLMAKAESAIAHLTEYRTALITAATTGQIDVRQVIVPASSRRRLNEDLSVQRPDDMMTSLL